MYNKQRSRNITADQASRQKSAAKENKKNAEKKLKDAKVKEASRAVGTGKAHGIVLYNAVSTASAEQQLAEARAKAQEQKRIADDVADAAKINAKAAKIEGKAAKYAAGKRHGFIVFNLETGETSTYDYADPYTGDTRRYHLSQDGKLSTKQVAKTARQVQNGRSKAAKDQDKKTKAKKTYPNRPNARQMAAWERHPELYDVEGVDAPKKKAPAKKSNAKKTGTKGRK